MKKLLCLIFVILTLSCTTVFAYTESSLDCAKKLYDLGLFKGSGDTFSAEGVDLDSNATRVQIAVTVTRMLGKEEKALYQKNPHSFSDVPAWASDYIGYLYENYLVNGISDTKFGSNDVASVQQFCTMLLRVLGYSDSDGGDFTYSNAKDFALKIGLIDNSVYGKNALLRGDMVQMRYTALNLPIKNSARTLGVKLLNEKVYTKEQAQNSGIIITNMLERAYSDIPVNLPSFTVEKISDTQFVLHLNEYVEHYGVRVFITKSDGVMKEVPYNSAYGYKMTKGKIEYLDKVAGYINTITVDVPSTDENFSFMLLKTSSESQIYKISGRSAVIEK